MGLIRKTLAVGTLGCVKGSSKKQRVAKDSLRTQQAILAELRATHAAQPPPFQPPPFQPPAPTTPTPPLAPRRGALTPEQLRASFRR